MKRTGVLILLIIIFVVSCARAGIPIDNAFSPAGTDFSIRFLFEVDGVRVYRFFDDGHFRYFSIGNGSYQPQTIIQSTGKTTYAWSDGANTVY